MIPIIDANISKEELIEKINNNPLFLSRGEDGVTIIEKFARNNSWELVAIALEKVLLPDQIGDALLHAVKANNVDIVQKLIAAGASPYYYFSTTKNSILHEAILNKNPILITEILSTKLDLSLHNIDNESPLLLAARLGQWDAVEAILKALSQEKGPNIYQFNEVIAYAEKEYQYKLRDILKANQFHSIFGITDPQKLRDILTKNPFPINELQNGKTPIVTYAENNNWVLVDLLADMIPLEINHIDSPQYGLALLLAVYANQLKTVKKLIAANASTTYQFEPSRNNILHQAVLHNNMDLINAVLASRVYIYKRNQDNESPFLLAARLGHWDAVVAILNALGQETSPNFYQFEEVSIYATHAQRVDILDLLKEKQFQSLFGITDPNTVSEILKKNPFASCEIQNELTPIQDHAHNNRWDLVNIFADLAPITYYTNPPDIARYGVALIYAIRANNLETVKKLLTANACLDYTLIPENNNTVVHEAVISNNLDILKAIIKTHANLSLKNSQNESPILLAANRGNWNAVELLLDVLGPLGKIDNFQYSKVMLVAERNEQRGIKKRLLELSKSVSAQWLTPLFNDYSYIHSAIVNNEEDEIKTLLTSFPTMLSHVNALNETPIIAALKRNRKLIPDLLTNPSETDENDDMSYGQLLYAMPNEPWEPDLLRLCTKTPWCIKLDNKLAFSYLHFEAMHYGSISPPQNIDAWAKLNKDNLNPLSLALVNNNVSFLKDALVWFTDNHYDFNNDKGVLQQTYNLATKKGWDKAVDPSQQYIYVTLATLCKRPPIDLQKKEDTESTSEAKKIGIDLHKKDITENSKKDTSNDLNLAMFHKIYNALYKAQSSFLKSKNAWENTILSKEEIIKHLLDKPNSRTAEAYRLTLKYNNTLNDNFPSLVRDIHTYGLNHSSSLGIAFFSHSNNQNKLKENFADTYTNADKKSRTGEIRSVFGSL